MKPSPSSRCAAAPSSIPTSSPRSSPWPGRCTSARQRSRGVWGEQRKGARDATKGPRFLHGARHLVGVFPSYYPDDIRGAVQLVFAVAIARTYTSGRHGAELIESFPKAFRPKPGLTGRAWLAAHYDSLVIDGMVSYLMAPGTRKRYDMPPPLPGLMLLVARTPLIAARE